MSSDNNCPATEWLATEHHRTGKEEHLVVENSFIF
jgi:hypothetical protein